MDSLRSGRAMRARRVPLILAFSIFLLQRSKNVSQENDLDAVELFAGDRSVTLALRRPLFLVFEYILEFVFVTAVEHSKPVLVFVRLSWKVIPWDLLFDGQCCNMNTVSGFASRSRLLNWSHCKQNPVDPTKPTRRFRSALQLVRRIREHGILWASPVCSTWVWMSRGSTGRSAENPLGDITRSAVREGNLMVSRCASSVCVGGSSMFPFLAPWVPRCLI